MDTVAELDLYYQNIMTKLNELTPDGIRDVDLHLLQELGLLTDDFEAHPSSTLTKFFQVSETREKITMFNESFVVWVVPTACADEPTTLVLVAHNTRPYPHLELAFATKGVYNSSKIILRVLEKFLTEIQETEDLLRNLEN